MFFSAAKETLISRTSGPNTYESNYQNFQITKISSFELIKKKVKKVTRKGLKYFLQIFFIIWEATL